MSLFKIKKGMKKILNSVLLTLVFVTNHAQSAPVANAMSATHLYSACNESKFNKYAKGFCEGAIDAFASSIQDWCVPTEITNGEVKDHVKNELLNSIPQASLGALEFVSRTIQKKWQCI